MRDAEALDSVARDFNASARAYDLRWARYNLASHVRTLEELSLAGRERILDVGCGTGELERHVLCRWPEARVVGLDLCDKMVDRARDKFASRAPVRFLVGNGQQLPFADGTFDVVISCSAFHFIPDRAAALREMHRVLAPGGVLVITDWCADYLFCRLLDRWLVATRRAAHAGSMRLGELTALLEAQGLAPRRSRCYRLGWFWGLMTVVSQKTR